MKAVIRKINYDTDTATLVGKKCVGAFGQSDGYEEQLLVMKTGHFFLYGVGGESSPYNEPKIKPISKARVDDWKQENGIA
ncbi:MAG: hypothetical protein FWF81_07285 [Defluviitaleaceae bacterium]|nr:hypothetical protein [Defluviitaleaceae bacterium]